MFRDEEDYLECRESRDPDLWHYTDRLSRRRCMTKFKLKTTGDKNNDNTETNHIKCCNTNWSDEGRGLRLIAPNYSVSTLLSGLLCLKNSKQRNLMKMYTRKRLYALLMVTQGLGFQPRHSATSSLMVQRSNHCFAHISGLWEVKQSRKIKDIYVEVIYEGDKFQIKNENKSLSVTKTDWWMQITQLLIVLYYRKWIWQSWQKKEITSWSHEQGSSKRISARDGSTVINRAVKTIFQHIGR